MTSGENSNQENSDRREQFYTRLEKIVRNVKRITKPIIEKYKDIATTTDGYEEPTARPQDGVGQWIASTYAHNEMIRRESAENPLTERFYTYESKVSRLAIDAAFANVHEMDHQRGAEIEALRKVAANLVYVRDMLHEEGGVDPKDLRILDKAVAWYGRQIARPPYNIESPLFGSERGGLGG